MEKLSDPPTHGTVSASGGELKAIGSFSARIGIEGLFSFEPAAAKVVVYKNLNADLLLGTAFFARAKDEGGETVSLGTDGLGYNLKAGGQTVGAVTSVQAWAVNKLMREYVELRRKKLPPGANYRNPILKQRKKIRTCHTPLQWRRMVKQVFPESFRLQGVSKKRNEIDNEEASTDSFPPPSDLICQVQGENRPGALFRLKEKVHIRAGQTKKVDVYYPQPPADRDNYAYLVEAADGEGKVRDPDEELRVDVRQGVLPLQAGQQGYGGTLQLLLVNNSDDKVVINQNSIVARGTVVKVAPAQSDVINMVRGKSPPAGTADGEADSAGCQGRYKAQSRGSTVVQGVAARGEISPER